MLKMLEAIFQGKVATEEVHTTGTKRMRGEVIRTNGECDLEACAKACPVKCFTIENGKPAIDYKKCLFCGRCVEAAAGQGLQHSNKEVLAEFLTETQAKIDEHVKATLGRSLHVRHLDAGSCNACDFEMGALSNPIYDLHRYGIAFVASPRHADMVMVTGMVTRNLEKAVRMTYEAMPEPRLVMACGACAAGGETFGSTYAIVGKVADVIPVDIAVPGCPTRPSAMIIALCAAADMLKEKM